MVYTREEVLAYVREEDVKFIRLTFCDIFGVPKNISVLAGELDSAFERGITFDGSAIPGFGGGDCPDLLLFPDPATLTVLPWRPSHGRVVRMYCDIRRPDGSPFEMDCRRLLKNAVSEAAMAGLTCEFGSENEFYLFKTDERGSRIREPLDRAGYMDIAPEDAGENARREICLTLEEMGIRPVASHHEEGPGQNEIDFRCGDPLTAADNSVTFKTVVRTVAAGNGLWADFDPKPLPDWPGNGMHISVSPSLAGGEDCFASFLAGLLRRVREMTLFLNPLSASYERLGGYKAPKYVSWKHDDRCQLIRIPACPGGGRRMELRSPDPAANPYIAYALVLKAGLEGVKEKLSPPPELVKDVLKTPHALLSELETLPGDICEAAELAKNSAFIKNCLPESLMEAYASDL